MAEFDLNPNQHSAVTYDQGPLLIIAGAGTGKTTVITERIKWLIQAKGLKPEQILALTFTEKAAQEMEERVDVALPMGYTQTWIMTFHGFCERVLRNEAVQIGLDSGFTILSEAETQLFVKEHLYEFDLEYFRPQGNPTKFLSGLITHFSRLRDEDISPAEYAHWWMSSYSDNDDQISVGDQEKSSNDLHEFFTNAQNATDSEEASKYLELIKAYQKYEELKIKHSVMDFADLIANTLRLFRERPNVLKQYQQRFPFILIDEFQDTNYAQNHLAIMLAEQTKNITVVADDDQAIYRWRGAAVYNVLDFEKHFPKTEVVTLTANYRSTQPILDCAYDLIQFNNPDRLEEQQGINKRLKSQNEVQAGRIKVIWEETVEDEADRVAQQIKSLKPETFSEIAILVRANNHAEPFTRALARHGIPYQFLGPGRLFRQNEIKDLIAYLKALANLHDNHAMYRVLSMPNLGIRGRDIQWLVTQAKRSNQSLFQVLETFGQDPVASEHGMDEPTTHKLQRLQQMFIRHLEQVKTASPGEILYYFLEDTGELLRMRDPSSEFEMRRIENIGAFFTRIKAYEIQHPEGKLNDFVEYLDFLIEAGESPLASQIDWTQENAVKILTIHSAKGLEFNTVFMVNLVNLRFPTINRKDQIPLPEALIKEPMPSEDPHISEERRLFYVGMTRAQQNLFFTGAKFYHDSATARPKKMSPFITEALGEDLKSYLVKAKSKVDLTTAIDDYRVQKGDVDAQLPLTKPVQVAYLSYSQIEAFETCPTHYKLDYILQIPKLPSGPLTFGTIVHDTLKHVYSLIQQNEIKPEFDEAYSRAIEYYETHWSPIGFTSKENAQERFQVGKQILQEFLAWDLNRDITVVRLEEPFTLNVADDLKVGGRIDRIDQLPDGKLEIIDYKTGRKPKIPELEKGLKGLQLSIYAMAAIHEQVLSQPLENLILSFHYLEGNERVSIERTHEDLQQAKTKILEVREQIQKSNFACSNSYFCQQGCEYSLFCG